MKLCGVIGPIDNTTDFAKLWSGTQYSIDMHQGIYEATHIMTPKLSGEHLVKASDEHTEVCLSFIKGFVTDCFPKENEVSERAREIVERNIAAGRMYLLLNSDSEPVSIAANVRESKNASTISLIYTPPEYRSRGYGSKVTALLSDLILKDNKLMCNLFTDLRNPTSNSIYQKIGYKKIGEGLHISFN